VIMRYGNSRASAKTEMRALTPQNNKTPSDGLDRAGGVKHKAESYCNVINNDFPVVAQA
jgi:hypothetical protein